MDHSAKQFLRWIALAALLAPVDGVRAQAMGKWEDLNAKSLSMVRGVNFVPDFITPRNQGNQSWYRGVAGPHAMWFFFDKKNATYGETKTQLTSLKRMGVNTIRVWLSLFNYWDNPALFVQKLDDFFELCSLHRIRVMPVIWDSHGVTDPVLTDLVGRNGNRTNITLWTPNPGILGVRVLADLNNYLNIALPYVRDIVKVAQRPENKEVVFCWDVWNEPQVASGADGVAYEAVIQWTGIALQYLDPGRHVTVGMAGWFPDIPVFPRLAKQSWLTVLSGHSYSHFIEGYEAHVRFGAMCLAKNKAAWPNAKLTKPFLITELGGTGGGADYSDALNYVRKLTLPKNDFGEKQGVGFMLWQGMVGIQHTVNSKVAYKSNHLHSYATGLVYTDGQVRDAAACNAFKAESIKQGVDKTYLANKFVQKAAADKLYYPLSPLPLGTNYKTWKSWIGVNYFDKKFLHANGGFTQAAIDASQLFAIVTDLTFLIHDQGPAGYQAFGLSPQLKLDLAYARDMVLDVKNTLTRMQRLGWLELWRRGLVMADAKASGPR